MSISDYLRVAVDVIIILFFAFSVNKTIKEDEIKGLRRMSDGLILMFAASIAFGVAQFASFIGFISAKITFSPLDIMTMMALCYFLAWGLRGSLKKNEKDT